MNDGDKKEQTSHNRSIFEEIHKLLAVASDMTDKRPLRTTWERAHRRPEAVRKRSSNGLRRNKYQPTPDCQMRRGSGCKSVINNMSCNQLPRKTLGDIFFVCEVVRALACYQGRNRLFGDAGLASERGLRIEFVHSLPYRPHAQTHDTSLSFAQSPVLFFGLGKRQPTLGAGRTIEQWIERTDQVSSFIGSLKSGALVQAFQSLVRQLLGKSDADLAIWRDALLEAL